MVKEDVKLALDMLHERTSELASGMVALQDAIDALRDALAANDSEETLKHMAELRKTADSLEAALPSSRWPLPKYREMLFVY